MKSIASSTRYGAASRPRLFVVSIWLALATALLSSLMPIGMPRSTALGSAFNPATTTVALQPSRSEPRTVVEATLHDENTASDGATDSVLVAAPVARHDVAPQTSGVRFTAPPDFVPPSRSALSGRPRGPPLS